MKPSIIYEILLAIILGIIGKRFCYISDQETNVSRVYIF